MKLKLIIEMKRFLLTTLFSGVNKSSLNLVSKSHLYLVYIDVLFQKYRLRITLFTYKLYISFSGINLANLLNSFHFEVSKKVYSVMSIAVIFWLSSYGN